MMMNRKQFLRSIAGVGATVVGAAVLAGCKDGGATSPVDGPDQAIDAPKLPIDAALDAPPPATCGSMISDNHGHAVMVPEADVTAGVDKTYNIQGTSGHDHTITVTAAMFTKLKANMPVVVPSNTPDGTGHSHEVTLQCAFTATCASTTSVIGSNHGHTLTVTGADVAAGVDKNYEIQGTSSHPHTVAVTAAMFAKLKTGMAVMVTSTKGNHAHEVTITCV